MKHPVESLHYSWVSTTTIVDTLWARLWCIHNPKILSWIGIGILGRYMNNFPKGTVTVYPNSVKNMQLILTWIVSCISLFYKYAKSEGPWLQNFSSYLLLWKFNFEWTLLCNVITLPNCPCQICVICVISTFANRRWS